MLLEEREKKIVIRAENEKKRLNTWCVSGGRV